LLAEVADAGLAAPARAAQAALEHADAGLVAARAAGRPALEADARRFALTLGRAMEVALLCRHAQWALAHEGDGRPAAAARRLAAAGIDLIADVDRADSALLARDERPVRPAAAAFLGDDVRG
ncbi:MAG TPA: hypothetical protein VFH27_10570, partial [Longimicrobiaceae bacterium]|nr:hypothetical protein [Longimicrobiaceae bacterium]